ncbi:MAG: hypothetical protein RI907_3196 [Pseudomonadota bacterium]|jgi:hypothetical protein
MKTRALTPLAGLVAAAALLAAPQAHALYSTLDPVAAVSQLSITSYSVVGGTASTTLSSPLPTQSLFNSAGGTPSSSTSGYAVLNTQLNAAGSVISETRQYYTTQRYTQSVDIYFTLSAMSVAQFDARLLAGTWVSSSASVSSDGSLSGSEQLPGVYSRSVDAAAGISIEAPGFNAYAPSQNQSSSANASGYLWPNNMPSQTGSLITFFNSNDGSTLHAAGLQGVSKYASLGVMNLTTQSMQGRLQLSTFTSVTDYAAPIVTQVPEADTALLALAGVVSVASLVRRRQRQTC